MSFRAKTSGQAGVVLLTATVQPSAAVPNLAIRNASERLGQYLKVFEGILSIPPTVVGGIVLAENSGYDLTAFRDLAEGRADVEFISEDMTGEDQAGGRAWLETSLVVRAVRRSDIVASNPGYVWKLTGRYQVANLASIIRSTPDGYDLVINLRRYPGHWADMFVYAATQPGIELLGSRLDDLRSSGQDEARMFTIVQDFIADGAQVLPRLPREPLIRGVRGWDGRPYDDPRQRIKRGARVVARRVAPGVWI